MLLTRIELFAIRLNSLPPGLNERGRVRHRGRGTSAVTRMLAQIFRGCWTLLKRWMGDDGSKTGMGGAYSRSQLSISGTYCWAAGSSGAVTGSVAATRGAWLQQNRTIEATVAGLSFSHSPCGASGTNQGLWQAGGASWPLTGCLADPPPLRLTCAVRGRLWANPWAVHPTR